MANVSHVVSFKARVLSVQAPSDGIYKDEKNNKAIQIKVTKKFGRENSGHNFSQI